MLPTPRISATLTTPVPRSFYYCKSKSRFTHRCNHNSPTTFLVAGVNSIENLVFATTGHDHEHKKDGYVPPTTGNLGHQPRCGIYEPPVTSSRVCDKIVCLQNDRTTGALQQKANIATSCESSVTV